ncbi:MAG: Nif3-like dinuclear metal center hexameric protein [bacterium]|nr:Nif3-like dinuclear metal center hexameric protein [bacterium]
MVKRKEIVDYLNEYLLVSEIADASLNGLQVQGPDEVTKIAFAVDYSSRATQRATEEGAQLLVVHHGVFWGNESPIIGILYGRVKEMFELGVGLYAVHLPLDIHPEVGNGVGVCRALGLEAFEPFGVSHGVCVGMRGVMPEPKSADGFFGELKTLFGDGVSEFRFGPETIETVGVVTGGGSSIVDQAVIAELDAFVTGEIRHGVYFVGEEGAVNLYACGHYATELTGTKALMAHIADKFDIETVLLDIPTGL